jgi:hypothetical protein
MISQEKSPMKITPRLAPLSLSLTLLLAGCGEQAAHGPKGPGTQPRADAVADEEARVESRVRQALAELSPEDRKLAEAQKFCAVQDHNRLGIMGKPVKVTVKDQTVFLCCDHCTKAALKDPDKTLAKVQKLKEGNAAPANKASDKP